MFYLTLLVILAGTRPSLADNPTREQLLKQSLLRAIDARLSPDHSIRDSRYSRGRDCLTPLVMELHQNQALFDPAERAYLTSLLVPWKDDIFQDTPLSDDPAPPLAGYSCHGRQGNQQLLGEHFSVEWDDAGVSESTAQFFLESLEYAWNVEVDEMGWNAPLSSDDYPILAYIVDDMSYSGAFTSVSQCSSYGYVPYIVAYTGAFSWDTWAEDMAAHEFNHAIQFSTSWAHEFWWWEATATWVEDQVHPDNDTWSYYISGYSDNPELGMTASSQQDPDIFYHMYGMAIMGFHLNDHFGGAEAVKSTWDFAEENYPYSYYGLYFPDAIDGMGLDFQQFYVDFMATSTVMDYEQQDLFPNIDLVDSITWLPASKSSDASTEPESLGQNYVRFSSTLGQPGDELEVTFDGEQGPDWFAVLVSTEDSRVVETLLLDLDETNSGTGRITFASGNVYLVISPMDDDAQGESYDWTNADHWSYTWEADLVGAQQEDSGSASGDTGDDSKQDSASCGCSSAGPAPATWLSLLAMVFAGLARRKP